MSEKKGNVFNIQKYSIHDGPGIRTTVFLKGCPLHCKWCHNPEGLSSEIQILRNEDKCVLCGNCVQVCPTNSLKFGDNKITYDRDTCILCNRCEKVCYYEAIEIVGELKTVDDIMKEVLKDKIFYEVSGGGVTFSGGEPFQDPKFLLELVKSAKEEGLHVAIDTSGFTKWDNIQSVIEYVDLLLYDFKMADYKKHKEYTGVSNELIVDNLKKLGNENIEIYLRLPMIRGVNDSNEDIKNILEIIKDINNISQVNILEYHSMGMEKYPRLGKVYDLTGEEKPDHQNICAIKEIFEKAGFKTVIGG